MGIETGGLRMPLTEMEEANTKKLAQAMRELGSGSHRENIRELSQNDTVCRM